MIGEYSALKLCELYLIHCYGCQFFRIIADDVKLVEFLQNISLFSKYRDNLHIYMKKFCMN
jgi:hypothetical protein